MKIVYIIILLSITTNVLAQRSKPDDVIPQVGKPMPDFTFHNVEHPDKEVVTLNDSKEKWLFLDFWYRGCTTCLTSLKKMNDLQQRYKDQIDVLMVVVNGKDVFGKGVKPLYERLHKKMNLQLTVTYDSIWCNRWNIHSFPHIIMVDPKHIVRVVTNGEDMTQQKVSDLLSGKDVSFDPKDVVRPPFDPLVVSVAEDSMLYRSQLSQWNGEQQSIPDIYGSDSGHAGIRVSRIPLEGLYNLAFFGKNQWLPTDSLYLKAFRYPVWEVKDESIRMFNYKTGKGIYNYELTLPAPKGREEIMQVIQTELYNSFGFEASLEEREMPVWKLVASKGAAQKLKTKGGAPGFNVDIEADGGAGGFGFSNYPIQTLLNSIIRFAPDPGIPYINETNILFNIDIEMNVVMVDAEAVKRELRRNGLDLVTGKKLMKVVVIKERRVNN